jgi:hypothetical protein
MADTFATKATAIRLEMLNQIRSKAAIRFNEEGNGLAQIRTRLA